MPAGQLGAAVGHWVGALASETGREAVAATKRLLNERFGDLLEAALDREEHRCVELFDGPEARAALDAFRTR